jgi:two-component system response regulator TctD
MSLCLIVENNSDDAAQIMGVLSDAGFVFQGPVSTIELAEIAIDNARSSGQPFELVVLELELDAQDGKDLILKMREKGDPTPVLVVSAIADAKVRVAALNAGADDVLPKPFDPNELAARAKALTRKHERAQAPLSTQIISELGNLKFHEFERTFSIKDVPVKLPKRMQVLLAELFRGRVDGVSKEYLMSLDFGYVSPETLDAQISRLRKKLTEIGAGIFVRSRYGLGYILVAEQRTDEPAEVVPEVEKRQFAIN